ncbi:MAG: ATP-binding protein [Vicinamibacteria bacterium]
MEPTQPETVTIRGTAIDPADEPQRYREKLARITLDSMVQFVGLLDAQGTVLEINKVALDAVGLTLADVQGRPFWTTFWWQVSPEVNHGIRDAVARAAQGEFVRWDTPLFASPDGSLTIIIDASVMPVKDDAGRVVFLACEGRDITEKKAQEREIAQKNLELQGLLARIRELDEIKTQFFANVSHELRTPLALIIGPAERLARPDAPLPAEAARETAQVIVRNARMLLKHVNDLLDISKLEAGKLRLDRRDTDVGRLVRFVASHFDVLAAERRLAFTVEAEPFVASVDAEKLQRVVMNLLSNAFKFAPPGGSVRCRAEAGQDALVLTVEDSGPGVPAELRQAIFERFRQGDGGSNRQFGGTGLGLAIAHEFVQMHQGGIEVGQSALGGALFRVTLPAVLPDAPAAPAAEAALDRSTLDGLIEELRLPAPSAPPAPQGARTRETVLVVEDNPDMNAFVAACLAPEYDVVTAFDGREGLERALATRPTVIVSDIMMPRVSGAELVAELRRHAEMDETPILLLSAKADDELKAQLLEEGAQDFVTKPFAERDLLVRVRNLAFARQAREALRLADRQKDDFLATLAHELRNPLAPIRHAARISRMPRATEEQVAWSHGVIERQVEHMARLLDDLLDASRITRGKLELRRERLSLNESLAAAVETARPLVEGRGHRLTVALPAPPVTVDADPVRLAQVFGNLLTNAAKYTDPGGQIHVRARVAGDEVAVNVEDSGIGIAPEVLPRIFEMFSQATSAIERSEGGLGIGLALARGLVLLHQGRIEARSAGLGRGSEFVVTLPVAGLGATAAPAAPSASPAGPHALRVLVADDNRDSADSLAVFLQISGHDVRTARSGREAVEMAAAFGPQVALLDIGMPGMNGYEVARHLRAQPGGDRLLLVAVTGWGQEEDKRLAREAGFDHHLRKPVDPDGLGRLLAGLGGGR